MKRIKHLAVLLSLALLTPVGLFARDKNQHSITISDPVAVGRAHLKPGDYMVEWQGDGPAVQVKFLKNGKLVATVPGTLNTNDRNVFQDDLVLHDDGANGRRLLEIDLRHQKEAIVLKQS
jgi:hypothetical protein